MIALCYIIDISGKERARGCAQILDKYHGAEDGPIRGYPKVGADNHGKDRQPAPASKPDSHGIGPYDEQWCCGGYYREQEGAHCHEKDAQSETIF